MRELMTSDRGAPGAKAKVRNALKRVDSEFYRRGPDIALEREDADVMGFCRDVVSKEAWKRWSEDACEDAVKNDSIERLKFLHECGCPWRKHKILYVCAEHGSVKCMKYLLKHGCKFSNQACTNAVKFGFLECLKYLRENGHDLDERTCMNAAWNGHLECLKYARENGCPWDEATCTWAAYNGHLECLKYAHEHGCPWDESTCSWAAEKGHLEMLKYAHEHGCPWNEWTCLSAARYVHLECLKYACAHGCPGSARYAEALNEVVLPDVDERFGVEVALVFHRSGEISMREFLPLWAEHRMFYRRAHLKVVRSYAMS
jgi:hypothetical protein